jgi:hypothetical protein
MAGLFGGRLVRAWDKLASVAFCFGFAVVFFAVAFFAGAEPTFVGFAFGFAVAFFATGFFVTGFFVVVFFVAMIISPYKFVTLTYVSGLCSKKRYALLLFDTLQVVSLISERHYEKAVAATPRRQCSNRNQVCPKI